MEQDFVEMEQLLLRVEAVQQRMLNGVIPIWTDVTGIQEAPASNLPDAISRLRNVVNRAREFLDLIPAFRAIHFPIS